MSLPVASRGSDIRFGPILFGGVSVRNPIQSNRIRYFAVHCKFFVMSKTARVLIRWYSQRLINFVSCYCIQVCRSSKLDGSYGNSLGVQYAFARNCFGMYCMLYFQARSLPIQSAIRTSDRFNSSK